MREIAFVGNAPSRGDVRDAVDRADRVVRFNKARGFGGRTGERVDDLFLVNCGGQMREWLATPGFWDAAPVRAARTVSLPIARGDPGSGLAEVARAGPTPLDGINFEHDVRRRLRDRPVAVRTMPDALRRAAIEALAAIGSRPAAPIWPSTGFLALFWYDRTEGAEAVFTLHGYGFRGWRGHPWERERLWVAARARSGRMRFGPSTVAVDRRSDAA